MERGTIRPIHDPQQHQAALDTIGRIMALDAPDDAELAMLETLAVLVERYEEKVFPSTFLPRSKPYAFVWIRWT